MNFALAGLVLTLSQSCKETAYNTEPCIDEKIEEFSKSGDTCDGAKVSEFEFKDKTVYLFDLGNCCCDYTSEVLDEACTSLGQLGGIAGNTEIEGLEFSNYARLVRVVWEK